jgi:two-component system chemotaxis response regulator CheY
MAWILFADDDPDMRDLAGLLLLARGHKVVTAGDGEEAIALLSGMVPDLVITDLNMPRQDGCAVCDAVRSRPDLRDTPLVVLTALPLDDQRVLRASAESGAVVVGKTDISSLGDLADSLLGVAGAEPAPAQSQTVA